MEKNKYLYNSCLILGNGFDLDLKLPTSYKDFIESKYWIKLCSCINVENSLIDYLRKKTEIENWYDLESVLLDYAMSMKQKRLDIEKIREEYECIVHALQSYLFDVVRHKKPSDKCFANKFLREYLLMTNENMIFTFNYTSVDFFAYYFGTSNRPHVSFIHGSLDDNNIILGFECDNFDLINPQLSFMMKSHSKNYKSTNMLDIMESSENIYIYGHSLNLIDKYFFLPLFERCISENRKKNITIITLDEKSDISIRNNIRAMGISIPMLFLNTSLKFVHTKDL